MNTSARRGARKKSLLLVGGAGGMGRLLARFFRARGYAVLVCDPKRPPRGFRRAGFDAARQADVVVVAASLMRSAEALERVLDERPEGLVLDVASVKAPVKGTLERAREAGVAVASVHPMFGPDVRSLRGRDLVVCDCGDARAARRAERLFAGAGLRIVRMTLEEHDAAIARTLGLAHLAGLAAAATLAHDPPPAGVPASTSFRLLRELIDVILAQPADLTFAIQAANPSSRDVAKRFAISAEALARTFEGSDARTLASELETYRKRLRARRR
jgi:chorismate mutase / prephenate dehydrogenase